MSRLHTHNIACAHSRPRPSRASGLPFGLAHTHNGASAPLRPRARSRVEREREHPHPQVGSPMRHERHWRRVTAMHRAIADARRARGWRVRRARHDRPVVERQRGRGDGDGPARVVERRPRRLRAPALEDERRFGLRGVNIESVSPQRAARERGLVVVRGLRGSRGGQRCGASAREPETLPCARRPPLGDAPAGLHRNDARTATSWPRAGAST